jgi:hypothetical protein
MWRLGGRRSSFHFVKDGGPSWPHDARVVGANTYSVFDNGVSRQPQYSRGAIWRLDAASHTASVVSVWRHSPDLYSTVMGSNRLLSNGNRLIDWAVPGVITEYSGHAVVFEADLVNAASYRVFRSVWKATPATPPTVAVHRTGTGVTVHADWNGATDVVRWDLLAGADAQHLRVVRAVPYTGFEVTQSLPVGGTDRVFAVRAVRSGEPAAQSGLVAAQ